MKKFAVILSGCGYLDGAEICEAVGSMIAIDALGATYKCFAPNSQFVAKDHINKKPMDSRNVMVEAARISRGKIFEISDLHVNDFDSLLFVGGYGIVLNISDFATKNENAQVLPDVHSKVTEFFEKKKPVGAICIAAVALALVLGKKANLALTLGEESNASMINSLGCTHVFCSTEDFVKDQSYNVFSTPAYMREDRVSLVYKGIFRMVEAMIKI